MELLTHIKRLCHSVHCRHAALSNYFGQDYPKPNCGACDICLGELDAMADSTVVAAPELVFRMTGGAGVVPTVDQMVKWTRNGAFLPDESCSSPASVCAPGPSGPVP